MIVTKRRKRDDTYGSMRKTSARNWRYLARRAPAMPPPTITTLLKSDARGGSSSVAIDAGHQSINGVEESESSGRDKRGTFRESQQINFERVVLTAGTPFPAASHHLLCPRSLRCHVLPAIHLCPFFTFGIFSIWNQRIFSICLKTLLKIKFSQFNP